MHINRETDKEDVKKLFDKLDQWEQLEFLEMIQEQLGEKEPEPIQTGYSQLSKFDDDDIVDYAKNNSLMCFDDVIELMNDICVMPSKYLSSGQLDDLVDALEKYNKQLIVVKRIEDDENED